VLREACVSIARDPAEITCSCLIRYESDDGALRARVAEMAAAGADLTIVSLPKSDPPSVVDRVAAAIG
jgi:hypothetical protein